MLPASHSHKQVSVSENNDGKVHYWNGHTHTQSGKQSGVRIAHTTATTTRGKGDVHNGRTTRTLTGGVDVEEAHLLAEDFGQQRGAQAADDAVLHKGEQEHVPKVRDG